MGSIVFLEETERVKLILTAKTPRDYIVGVKNAKLVKQMLFVFYLISLIISILRFTLIYKYPEAYESSVTIFIILTVIDLTLNFIAQIIILYVFYFNFRFFLNEHMKNVGYQKMPFKLKLLSFWIVIIVL